MSIKNKIFPGGVQIRMFILWVFAFLIPLSSCQASNKEENSERVSELKMILERYESGSISREKVYKLLDGMLDEKEYSVFLGPHIMALSAADMVAPDESERVFRRALVSLQGKDFVTFLVRNFDRAMEIDRVYLFDERRFDKDSDYRKFWEDRGIFNFTVSELDSMTQCYDIFDKKDEWTESALNKAVNNPPCSNLREL